MTALLSAEEIACAADFEVAHGDTEAAAEGGVLFHGIDAFAGIAAGHFAAGDHEVGVGLVTGAADAAAELVEVGEAEAVGAVDDDGIGVRDIDAAFDDGGADEDVGLTGDEAVHDFLELTFLHLTVTGFDGGAFGAEGEEFFDHAFDAADAVVEEEDLALAVEFAFDGFLDDAFVVGADDGFDG